MGDYSPVGIRRLTFVRVRRWLIGRMVLGARHILAPSDVFAGAANPGS
jgi:hypothetical protein